MTNYRSLITVENFFYFALFAFALTLRLYGLNAPPLNDAEAREALSVFRLLQGQPGAALPHSPAYFFFTYFSFLIFDASNATARLAPAVFGAGLVFLPMFFRDSLGRTAALLTSGLLAISAGLLAASRSADGAIIALFALGLSIGAFRQHRMTISTLKGLSAFWLVVAAVALGVGLASGASFLTGLIVLGLTALVTSWVNPDEREILRETWATVRLHAVTFFISLGLAVLVVATVGLIYRTGLSALTNSFGDWLAGFAPSAVSGLSRRSPLTLLIFLFVYEPMILVFGIVGAVLAFRRAFRRGNPVGQWLFWFALIALAFAMLYSGRTLFHIIWVIAPLAALAGWALVELVGGVRLKTEVREDWPLAAAQAGAVTVLLGFAGLNLASFSEQVRINPDVSRGQFTLSGLSLNASATAHVYLAIVAVVLALIVSYLFGMGWSPRAARLGLTLSAAAALLTMSLSAGWGLTQLRTSSPVELWWDQPIADDLNRLMDTLGNVSNYAVGNEHDVEVTVQASPDGALAWALRGFPHATFVEQLDPLVTSPVVIAPATPTEEQNPTLGSAYVGQGFSLRHFWFPANLTWPEQIAWWVFRRAPVQSEQVILWVRQDVAQLQSAGETP